MIAAGNIRHSTGGTLEVIQVMNEALVKLHSQAQTLKKEMGAFRI